jgi:putative monooxygenase
MQLRLAAAVAASALACSVADAKDSDDGGFGAAVTKVMNDFSAIAQSCWAVAATERFDIDGDITLRIEFGANRQVAMAMPVHNTVNSEAVTSCLIGAFAVYKFPPPLAGKTIELPFHFSKVGGQSVIDRTLVSWKAQDKISIAVLLDEANTGNPAASMFEVALKGGASTARRKPGRAELWLFLGDAEVRTDKTSVKVGALDMMYVGASGTREISAGKHDVHAVVVAVPGGREGAARAGALPAPLFTGTTVPPTILRAADAKAYGPVTIYAEPATIPDLSLSASVLQLAAGAKVPEHVHAKETELLYVLAGSGTITIAGTAIAVTASSVIQIPPNTKHAFEVSEDFKALQIYTPAGPEQRFKK